MGVKFDIHDRIFNFVIQVVTFVKVLPRTDANKIIINQVLRSATSMGANDQEADGASTKKEFVHKYGIVKKEGKETGYWLRVINETNHIKKGELDTLITECNEIVLIVNSIISKSNKTSLNRVNNGKRTK